MGAPGCKATPAGPASAGKEVPCVLRPGQSQGSRGHHSRLILRQGKAAGSTHGLLETSSLGDWLYPVSSRKCTKLLPAVASGVEDRMAGG